MCLPLPGIRPFVHSLVNFLLLLAIETINVNDDIIFMCKVNANSNICCFDVSVSSSPSNKTICSILVHFLLLLAIETLNVIDNMM